jgi:hypothetical protein
MEEDQIPEWLTAGVTVLTQENENAERPKNYRPVTCLFTVHKTITPIISKRMPKYTDEKIGCQKNIKGAAAEDQKMQRSTTNIKRDITGCKSRRKKFVYGMGRLSESFRQCTSQLDNQSHRINWDQ